MCIETECVLQLSSNPLFTPVPVMDGHVPLKDCVLSVSQFTGAERESLVELAKHLGAEYVCTLCLCFRLRATNTNSFHFQLLFSDSPD